MMFWSFFWGGQGTGFLQYIISKSGVGAMKKVDVN
jgi:hypothetical protein